MKKAGTASAISSQWIFFKLANIIIPTIIKIGAVAAVGTIARSGLKKLEIAKQIATTKAVKPVRPPAPIPAADST
ncbi:Uncharacterised protein [Streptococcus pneumoniae]|nr:Uncharacterised protein [Streptococcus pneumoniae]